MYLIKKVAPFGREALTVSENGKRVGSASMQFVKWMWESIPKHQLRPEQRALVDWYEKQVHSSQGT